MPPRTNSSAGRFLPRGKPTCLQRKKGKNRSRKRAGDTEAIPRRRARVRVARAATLPAVRAATRRRPGASPALLLPDRPPLRRPSSSPAVLLTAARPLPQHIRPHRPSSSPAVLTGRPHRPSSSPAVVLSSRPPRPPRHGHGPGAPSASPATVSVGHAPPPPWSSRLRQPRAVRSRKP
jgi:hypothetical protein